MLVLGFSGDKDIAGIVREISGRFDKIIVTSSRHPRAASPGLLQEVLGALGIDVEVAGTVPQALSRAREVAGSGGFILVTGSIFVVGEAIEYLDKPAEEPF